MIKETLIKDFLSSLEFDIVKGRRKKDPESVNLPFSFDIETTSFYRHIKTGEVISVPEFQQITNKKKANQYEKGGTLCAWGFGIKDKVFFGRTWEDLIKFFRILRDFFDLSEKRILPVYVHNLSYEFGWIEFRFHWLSVFAVNERQPIRALSDYGIEFRDSLIVSGMSLDKTAESLTKHKIDKLIGDWDYHALRGSRTEIKPLEWKYLENDNLIVLYYVAELMERFGDIQHLPMTKTAIVREDVRSYCFWGTNKSHKKDKDYRYINYSRLMRSLRFESLEERNIAKMAFAGGFTHANAINAGIVLENVSSKDISSSYPTIMVSERFPMGKGQRVEPKSKEEFQYYLNNFCCLMQIGISDLQSIFPWDHILSRSKCEEVEGAVIDNGRIIEAKSLITCITEIDYECLKRFYKWKKTKIYRMWIYHKSYLPKAIIEKVIEYYEKKTTLKGVEGKESEYALSKTLINSIYGMMVYDPLKDEIKFDGQEWTTEKIDSLEALEKYNNSKSRFNSFLWGIWITAYARRNLFSAILAMKEDHVYSDTDSEKYLHAEKHEGFFAWYNGLITKKIRLCLDANGIDPERSAPKDINGHAHPLGVFENDGVYARFCTLGAKRYAVDYGEDVPEEKRYSLTISGVDKTKAIPEIVKRMKAKNKDFFDYFHFGVIYDREMCGKLTHTYIEEPIEGDFIDKDGLLNHYEELSFVHLEETTYEMTATDDYISLLESYSTITYID